MFTKARTSLSAPLGFVLLLHLLTPEAARACAESTDHDVVIIGAGAAGLYAAYELNNRGYDVLVLEAGDRHGGRMGNFDFGDVRVELGAESLYGARNNFVFDDIVALLGAGAQIPIFTGDADQDTLISMDGGNTCWEEWGDCWMDADIADYWDFYDEAFNHGADPSDRLVSEWLETEWGIDTMHRAYHLYDGVGPGAEYGTTIQRMGIRSLSRQGWDLTNGVFGLAPMGYLEVLEELYFNTILDRVLLNSAVGTVDTSGPKPVAVDVNGVHHYADAVIVTVSLGVLKAGYIDFVPPLPAQKLGAIETLGMGKGMKLFLRFSEQFWDDAMFLAVTEGPTGMCWVPGKYQPGSTDHVLTCFIMGENAELMTGLPDDGARTTQALADLDLMFADAATPAFVESVVQDWTSEPFVLGSYSFPSPGSYPDGGPNMRQLLAAPVDGTIYFAGEATSEEASSTVPGALRTGQRAAAEADASLGGAPDPARPEASFAVSITSGLAPLDVDFTDMSTGAPASWEWDFGDGNGSIDQDSTHRYTAPGLYTVSLNASNASGSHLRVRPHCVDVLSDGRGRLQSVELNPPWPGLSEVFASQPCTAVSDLRICDEAPGAHVVDDGPVFPADVPGSGSLTFIEYDSDLGSGGETALIDVRKGLTGGLEVDLR